MARRGEWMPRLQNEKLYLMTILMLTAAFTLAAAILKTLKNACDLRTSYVVMRRTS